jgi:hypothetical protein
MSAEKIADIQQVEGQMPGTETLTGGSMEAAKNFFHGLQTTPEIR